MGQYHLTVNIDKKEFLDPHTLGDGLKLVEQFGNPYPGIRSALLVLLACSNGRGLGDLPRDSLVGHWAGDRIAVVGDYTEPEDITGHDASVIYDACRSSAYYPRAVTMPLQSLNPDDTFALGIFDLEDSDDRYMLVGDRYEPEVLIQNIATGKTHYTHTGVNVATYGNPSGMWLDRSFQVASYLELAADGRFVSHGTKWRHWETYART